MHRVFFGHHKAASRFFRLSVFLPIAEANGWDVVRFAIQHPPYHFSAAHHLDLDNFDFERLKDPTPAVVCLSNTAPQAADAVRQAAADFRGLHAVRDPRAMLVSAYFHHRDGHGVEGPGWVWDKLIADRQVLQSLPLEDGLLYELENITGSVFDEQMRVWQPDERILEVRAEDVRRQRDDFLVTLAEHLQVPQMPSVKWRRTYSDSGAQGWQEHFTPRLKAAFKQRYGEWLVDLGYEQDDDW